MSDLRIHLNRALYDFETPPPPVLFACAAPATPFWDWGICPELNLPLPKGRGFREPPCDGVRG
jgi:hypothetical protein